MTLSAPRVASALLLALFVLSGLARAQEGTEPIVATDLLQIRQIDDVTTSPDGRYVAYTVQQIVETPSEDRPYAYRTHLWMVPADGSRPPRQMTRGPRSVSQLAWHPESDRIAFVRATESGSRQLFVLSLTGGEPYQLTDFEHGASSPRWAPSGEQMLFSAGVPKADLRQLLGRGPSWSDERPGRSPADTVVTVPPDSMLVLRDSLTRAPLDTIGFSTPSARIALLSDSLAAFPDTITVPAPDVPPTSADPNGSLVQVRKWLDDQQRQNNPRVFTRLDVQGERDLNSALRFRHWFVLDVNDDGAEGTPRRITDGFYSWGGGTWLPNGNQVIVTGVEHPNEHPDRVEGSDLYLADVDSTAMQRLLRLQHYDLYAPRVTPDGTALAFLARDRRDNYAQTEIGLFPLDGRSAPELITTDFDRSVGSPTWAPDGWYLYFTAASEGGFPLYRMAPFAVDTTAEAAPTADAARISGETFAVDSTMMRPRSVEQLTAIDRGVRSFDVTTASAYYVITEITNPYELYANNAEFGRERRLSSHNATWLDNKRISRPTTFTVTHDTLDIQGWVMPPTTRSDTASYPLLVEMHGGPSAMWGPGEATMWHEFQLFAARGYGIVYSNPRGSGGYGRDFKAANFQDWGTGPAGDVLAAAEYAADLAWTDSTRQVLTGGSYAGYLTAWMVSQDHRFQAAVAQRGVYDLPVFFGEGRAWRLVPDHFGGYPWEGDVPPPMHVSDSLWAQRDTVGTDSTIADTTNALPPREALLRNSPITYVDQIITPLLIIHADEDLRTGVIQSEALYKSLKVLGRPVEYVRYPNAGHDLSRSGDPQQRIDRLLRIYEFMERFIDSAPQSRQPPVMSGR
jgi:dipeptidyl aminopeptidase/acylaminoacyl peptidase